jgi:TPR repeat protein
MLNLADMYLSGLHVPRDVVRAVTLYRLAASAGVENAFFSLCEIFRDGAGVVPPDRRLADEAARASVDHKFFRGLVQLAELLDSGKGGVRDRRAARDLFKRAHGPEHALAQCGLADAFAQGRGCEVNQKKAFAYYKISAKNGHVPAMVALGRCYAGASASKAARWFKQSAEAGSADGCALYGEALRLGRGVSRSFDDAERWLANGAAADNGACFASLARMHRDGQGRKKEPAEARRLFGLAAERGCVSAMIELGVLCEEGIGGPKDPTEATEYYGRAMENGDAEGAERLARAYEDGRGVQRDLDRACKLYEKANELGSKTACAALARVVPLLHAEARAMPR